MDWGSILRIQNLSRSLKHHQEVMLSVAGLIFTWYINSWSHSNSRLQSIQSARKLSIFHICGSVVFMLYTMSGHFLLQTTRLIYIESVKTCKRRVKRFVRRKNTVVWMCIQEIPFFDIPNLFAPIKEILKNLRLELTDHDALGKLAPLATIITLRSFSRWLSLFIVWKVLSTSKHVSTISATFPSVITYRAWSSAECL